MTFDLDIWQTDSKSEGQGSSSQDENRAQQLVGMDDRPWMKIRHELETVNK